MLSHVRFTIIIVRETKMQRTLYGKEKLFNFEMASVKLETYWANLVVVINLVKFHLFFMWKTIP